MLRLICPIGKKLIIGDVVIVTILGTQGKEVRIGILAPKRVRVRRAEISPIAKKK